MRNFTSAQVTDQFGLLYRLTYSTRRWMCAKLLLQCHRLHWIQPEGLFYSHLSPDLLPGVTGWPRTGSWWATTVTPGWRWGTAPKTWQVFFQSVAKVGKLCHNLNLLNSSVIIIVIYMETCFTLPVLKLWIPVITEDDLLCISAYFQS